MNLAEILFLAVGLSMDAFAISICKGLALTGQRFRGALSAGCWFGGFQALMPLLGYFAGSAFSGFVAAVDHWIAFAVLTVIGINMIRESKKENAQEQNDALGWKTMLPLAVATSIDALAAGVTFAFLDLNVYGTVLLIGLVTFCFSFTGVLIGKKAGALVSERAEQLGGAVLILIGLKILLEHLGVFA